MMSAFWRIYLTMITLISAIILAVVMLKMYL